MRQVQRIALLLIAAFSLNAAASTVTYSYDAAGRLLRADYGNGRGFVYRYDANGNLISRTGLPQSTRHRGVGKAQAPPPDRGTTMAENTTTSGIAPKAPGNAAPGARETP